MTAHCELLQLRGAVPRSRTDIDFGRNELSGEMCLTYGVVGRPLANAAETMQIRLHAMKSLYKTKIVTCIVYFSCTDERHLK
jgi:hypothetical protein